MRAELGLKEDAADEWEEEQPAPEVGAGVGAGVGVGRVRQEARGVSLPCAWRVLVSCTG